MTPQVLMGGLGLLVSVVGLVSGLIGAYVGLQNRILLAEVRQELAELENRILTRINGTYARNAECFLRHEVVNTRVEDLASELREVSRAERRTEEG